MLSLFLQRCQPTKIFCLVICWELRPIKSSCYGSRLSALAALYFPLLSIYCQNPFVVIRGRYYLAVVYLRHCWMFGSSVIVLLMALCLDDSVAWYLSVLASWVVFLLGSSRIVLINWYRFAIPMKLVIILNGLLSALVASFSAMKSSIERRPLSVISERRDKSHSSLPEKVYWLIGLKFIDPMVLR